MGDEDEPHAEAVTQIGHETQDLGLNGDIESGRRLIGDEEIGVVGDRHGDHHPLALTARQFVRIGSHPAFGKGYAHELQEVERALVRRIARDVLVMNDRLDDLAADRVERIERGHRLLEDHGDLPPTDGVELPLGQAEDVAAAIIDFPGCLAVRGEESHGRHHHLALAGS